MWETKAGRIIAFSMTRIRNAVISKINEQGKFSQTSNSHPVSMTARPSGELETQFEQALKADKINDFRGQGLNVYVTFDLLKSQLHSGHWINCSFQDFEKTFQIGLASGSNSQKLAAMQERQKLISYPYFLVYLSRAQVNSVDL